MRFAALVTLFLAVLLGTCVPSASARLIENWPYEKLFKESDLVVIAKATESKDSGEKAKLGWDTDFIGVNTSFEVQSTLKGKADKKLTVLHFRVKEGVLLANGPLLVSFRDTAIEPDLKNAKVALPAPEYMLFLKAAKDGRYEPVSGRIDPELSVREIFPGGTGGILAGEK
jgi:hypothetical protein